MKSRGDRSSQLELLQQRMKSKAMSNNPNQPRPDDAVLGGQTPALMDALVLGGIAAVKRRFANPAFEVRVAALSDALKYGEAGLDLAIAALGDDSSEVFWTAYSLLQEQRELKARQALQDYKWTAIKLLEFYAAGKRNFTHANLSEVNLSGVKLADANLSRAKLLRANLRGCNLSGTDLSGANLSGADLSEAKLNLSDLCGADLCGANLSRANLSRANLSGADLRGVNLSWADLCGAKLAG